MTDGKGGIHDIKNKKIYKRVVEEEEEKGKEEERRRAEEMVDTEGRVGGSNCRKWK